MKEQYEELEAEVIRFEPTDVITDSPPTETPHVQGSQGFSLF